ncbi:hypothetical protein Sjap_012003 [Stephania japonica]|uniref:Secreted protein n=1 Tax=Stephania japonica TaxID=461633 RepID=A0AAP0P8K1_9MAGN
MQLWPHILLWLCISAEGPLLPEMQEMILIMVEVLMFELKNGFVEIGNLMSKSFSFSFHFSCSDSPGDLTEVNY